MKGIFHFKLIYLLQLAIFFAGFVIVLVFRDHHDTASSSVSPPAQSTVKQSAAETIEPQPEAEKQNIQVLQAVMCLDIEDQKPVLIKETFSRRVDRLTCFVRLISLLPRAVVSFHWIYRGPIVVKKRCRRTGPANGMLISSTIQARHSKASLFTCNSLADFGNRAFYFAVL